MSKPPSDKPPDKPTKETIPPAVQEPARVKRELFPFGLSAKQFARVERAMLAVAQSVCRHPGAIPDDAVQQAFVKALSKPSTEQPSIQNEEKFVALMCTLAKFEALTNRNDQRRRARREVASTVDIAELVGVPPGVGAVEARKMLDRAFMALKPDEQALLHALYAEGKSIEEIADEQKRRASTLYARRKRLLALLRAAIQAAIAALVLLVPKKARAFVANITQQAPHALVQATQFSGAMTVMVVCGGLLPTGSSVMTDPSTPVGLTPYSTPQTAMARAASLQPSFLPEVEPEEPKALDAETNQCSAADMKSTKVASFLPETIVPMAFSVATALTQVACTGTAQQTPPACQAEDDDDGVEDMERGAYEAHCSERRARKETCPTFEEWRKQ